MAGSSPAMTTTTSHLLRAPGDRADAGARDFDEAQGRHQHDELVDLVGLAGELSE